MKTILEFQLDVTDEQNLLVPTGSTPLHVGTNPHGKLCVWFLTDPSQLTVLFKLWMFTDRQPMPDLALKHLASVKFGTHEDFIRLYHVFVRA